MPLNEGEALLRCIQQLQKYTRDAQLAIHDVGTPRDATGREVLRRLRALVFQCDERTNRISSLGASKELVALLARYNQSRREFDDMNLQALRKEKQTAHLYVSERECGPCEDTERETQRLLVQEQLRDEWQSTEKIQGGKLQGALELESDLMDLMSTYQDFHSLVQQQQVGLDMVTSHIADTTAAVSRGNTELQQASQHQRSSRRWQCCVGLMLVITALVVVAVVVITMAR